MGALVGRFRGNYERPRFNVSKVAEKKIHFSRDTTHGSVDFVEADLFEIWAQYLIRLDAVIIPIGTALRKFL